MQDGQTRPVSAGSFATVAIRGESGETVTLRLPMPTRYVVAHPRVTDAAGRVAVFRGPLLYCAEAVDNQSVDVRDLLVNLDPTGFQLVSHDRLEGAVALVGECHESADSRIDLYRPWSEAGAATTRNPRPVQIVLTPYYAWANGEPGAMRVWLRKDG